LLAERHPLSFFSVVMSLINEALKKAQRQRAAEAAAGQAGPATEPPERVEKRAKAMRAQTVILLAAAATVLIVFSVVITVYWVNSTPEPAPVAARSPAATKSAPPLAAAAAGPRPITVALPTTAPTSNPPAPSQPASSLAGVEPKSATTPANIVATAQATTSPAVSAAATSAPVLSASATTTATPPPIEIPPVSTAPQPDPRVQAFVDTVRVAGIRSSGADSKVIMNDRVYRVNDIVERNLGVKLVKVEPDTLTFADPNGLTYTKTF
jgi:hypothetical protein